MKKINVLIVFMLSLAFFAVSLTAYGVDVPSLTETEEKMEEIYNSTDMALTGIYPPEWMDRSNIEKALPKETKEHLKLGFSISRLASPFFVEMANSARDLAEKYGHEIVILNANGNLEKQRSDVDSMIVQEVDGIILNPVDNVATMYTVKKCVEAGIPVVGNGLAFTPEVPVVTSILTNNYFAGWDSGCIIGEHFGDNPMKAAVILGGMGQPMSESRINGMLGGIVYTRQKQIGEPVTEEQAIIMGFELWKTIRKKGKVTSEKHDLEVVNVGQGQWTNEGGMTAAQDILTANPEINLMLVGNDEMGEGALKAAKLAGLTPGIDIENGEIAISCNADGQRVIMDYIKQDEFLNSGYYNPYITGEACVELFHKIYVEGYDASNMPHVTLLPSFSITKENVDEYYDPELEFAKAVPYEFKTVPELNAELNE